MKKLILIIFLLSAFSCEADLKTIIHKESTKRGLDPFLMEAMFIKESSLNPNKIGGVGEIGLGQIRYEMHKKKYNIRSERLLFNARYNVMKSLDIFKDRKEACGSYYEAFRCYNAGVKGAKKYNRGHEHASRIFKIRKGL